MIKRKESKRTEPAKPEQDPPRKPPRLLTDAELAHAAGGGSVWPVGTV